MHVNARPARAGSQKETWAGPDESLHGGPQAQPSAMRKTRTKGRIELETG